MPVSRRRSVGPMAAADGYKIEGMRGIDFHAANPAYEHYVIRPARPDRRWSAHRVARARAHLHRAHAPGLAGLLSPLGTCPIGTFDLPLTAEMIHIWIVPGAPDPIGDLDDAWKRAFLQGQ